MNLPSGFLDLEIKIRQYASVKFPKMAGKMGLKFIDDNFRRQSYEGIPWHRRKKTDSGRALLIYRGRLRRSWRMKAGDGYARLYSDSPYAKVHNQGFNGIVNVPAHQRRKFGRARVMNVQTRRARTVRVETGEGMVKAHTRKMRIPRRQHAPYGKGSNTLNNQVKRMVTLDVIKIIKEFNRPSNP